MPQKYGPWTIQKSSQKYHSEFIDVYEDQVLDPNGQPATYVTVRSKVGVAILPIDKEGNAYLTRQFRYGIGEKSLEVASGSAEEGETPLEAAQRELKEELGIQAEEWKQIGLLHPDTSIVWSPVYLFVAKNLNFTATHRESSEIMETVKFHFKETVQMVMDSHITHSPTSVLILKTNQLALADG